MKGKLTRKQREEGLIDGMFSYYELGGWTKFSVLYGMHVKHDTCNNIRGNQDRVFCSKGFSWPHSFTVYLFFILYTMDMRG